MTETPKVERKEFFSPHSIAIATTTFYPEWYPGELNNKSDIDKVRGDLFIQLLEETLQKGYQISVVDGGSSAVLIEAVGKLGVRVVAQEGQGMSSSRRQVLTEASKLSDARVICWTEPEKFSLIRDCFPAAVEPILNGEADIVVPKRDEEAFKTYPSYQADYEKRANLLWNKLLRSRRFLPVDEELDVWFGPKFLVNRPEVLDLFLRKFTYKRSGSRLDEKIDPERWSNSTFIPVVAALQKGFRVLSVTVPYRHPPLQLESEKDSEEFKEKRELQLRDIIVSTIHFLRLSDNDTRAKLREID